MNMASAGKDPRATTPNYLLPVAIPRLPIIPKMEKPKFNAQAVVEMCQNLGEMVGSAVDEFVQSIEKTFKTLASDNPFVGDFITRCKNPTQVHCKIGRHSNPLSFYNFAAILPGDSVVESVVTNGITNFLNIYNTLLITRLILTWFPNSPAVIVNPLSTLCDPYLNIFRGIIPPLGGTLDLSPILAFFVLNAFTSTAAALPAELPKDMERTSGSASAPIRSCNGTTKQRLWLKRQCTSCEDQSKVDHRD